MYIFIFLYIFIHIHTQKTQTQRCKTRQASELVRTLAKGAPLAALWTGR